MSGDGISFSYDNQTNTMSATLTATDSGLSVNDFGDGFSLDNNKIVTRKLYSTNPNNSSTHYRLELTTGGTIKLPDQSEIIGSTLKGVAGTGDLNYTGITIGPSNGNSENTWMYVDAYNAYIATDYANTQKTWKFDKDGILNLPNNNGQIGQLSAPYTGLEFRTGSGADRIGISYGEINDNNTSYFYFDKDGSNYTTANHRAHLQIKNPAHDGHVEWLFDSAGKLTLPNGSTIGDGDANFGVPITTARGTILIGNQSDCSNVNHFHIMRAGQQAIELFLGDDNNYVKLPSAGGVEISSSEIVAQHYWTFGTDGKLSLAGNIKFSDNTIQTSAWTGSNPIDYANIVNVPIPPEIDIDGGHALASFTVSANADGGGSSQRFGPNSTVFNGGGAIELYTNTLDGGGA
jgi:hypothetical protein